MVDQVEETGKADASKVHLKLGDLPRMLGFFVEVADEASRLVVHDDGGFMSRVAFLAPAPANSKVDKDNTSNDNAGG